MLKESLRFFYIRIKESNKMRNSEDLTKYRQCHKSMCKKEILQVKLRLYMQIDGNDKKEQTDEKRKTESNREEISQECMH